MSHMAVPDKVSSRLTYMKVIYVTNSIIDQAKCTVCILPVLKVNLAQGFCISIFSLFVYYSKFT